MKLELIYLSGYLRPGQTFASILAEAADEAEGCPLGIPSCSGEAFNWLDEAHPRAENRLLYQKSTCLNVNITYTPSQKYLE